MRGARRAASVGRSEAGLLGRAGGVVHAYQGVWNPYADKATLGLQCRDAAARDSLPAARAITCFERIEWGASPPRGGDAASGAASP